MSQLRIGLIGLSANAKTSWAANAHLPYLTSSHSEYSLVALCNSSVAAARAAIEAFKLPASTRAYGNPVDLANDSEIDLVVCTTRVDVHYETIRPSLLKGKKVYCEWPLAENLESAEELAKIAKETQARTMVGLQGQISPVVLKMKSLIDGGRIGRILSGNAIISGGSRTRDTLIEGLRYFAERKVGGNPVTIGLGHSIDFMLYALGEMSSFRAQLSLQRPNIEIIGADGTAIGNMTSDVPDHVMLQGKLLSHADVPFSVTFRRGQPFKDSPGLIWSLNGEYGEIRLTSTAAGLNANDAEARIDVYDFAQDSMEVIQVEHRFLDLPVPARNVAALYEAFARKGSDNYPDFQHAAMRHRMIEEMFKSSEKDIRAVYL